MNQATGSQYLENEGLFTLSAQIYGRPTFVEVIILITEILYLFCY